jgi:hypothetical protein
VQRSTFRVPNGWLTAIFFGFSLGSQRRVSFVSCITLCLWCTPLSLFSIGCIAPQRVREALDSSTSTHPSWHWRIECTSVPCEPSARSFAHRSTQVDCWMSPSGRPGSGHGRWLARRSHDPSHRARRVAALRRDSRHPAEIQTASLSGRVAAPHRGVNKGFQSIKSGSAREHTPGTGTASRRICPID